MGIINDNTRTRNIEVGKIDLMKRFSFFEVDKKYEKEIIEGFKDADFRGTKISVELSNARPETSERSGDSYGKRKDRGGSSRSGGGSYSRGGSRGGSSRGGSSRGGRSSQERRSKDRRR